MEIGFHVWHGVPFRRLFHADIEVVPEGDRAVILIVKNAAVFSNWIGVRKIILQEAEKREEVVIDLSNTCLVDHSVMEKLHELERVFMEAGKRLSVKGLEAHVPFSPHPLAARKPRRPLPSLEEPVASAG